MLSREQIESILRLELEIAREGRRDARTAFKAVIGDTPSGLPSPDGTFRIQACAEELAAAPEQTNAFRVFS